jgi:hypothetical protein
MVCTAARGGRVARPQAVDQILGRLGSLVVEELPVDHNDGGEIAGRVAFDVLEGDRAVLGRLVVTDDAEML